MTAERTQANLYKSLDMYSCLAGPMPRRMKISEARGRLPEIAKYLSRHPDQVVLVEHRDLDERMALTTERHLHYLETLVTELRRQVSSPFRLAGSMTSELTDRELDTALEDMRDEQARLREEKLREIAS